MMLSTRKQSRVLIAAVAAGVTGLVSPTVVLAQAEAPPPEVEVTSHNAALLYYTLWAMMGSFPEDTLDSNVGGYSITSDGHEILEENKWIVQPLLKATRQENADWGIQYELGPNAILPYLGWLRRCTRFLAADALRCAQDGDSMAAAERVVAIHSAGGHLSGDRILISSLVGIALSNLANRISLQLADDGLITPEAAEVILESLREIDLENLFGLRDTVIGERDLMADYVITHYTGPDAGVHLLDAAPDFLGQEFEKAGHPMASLSGEALRQDVLKSKRYYDDVLAVWNDPDAAVKISELTKKIETGAYGEFAKLYTASFQRVRRNTAAYHDDHAEALAVFERIANP